MKISGAKKNYSGEKKMMSNSGGKFELLNYQYLYGFVKREWEKTKFEELRIRYFVFLGEVKRPICSIFVAIKREKLNNANWPPYYEKQSTVS